MAATVQCLFAADITWSGVDGFWKSDSSWVGKVEPTGTDTAIFPVGGYTVNIDKSTTVGMVVVEGGVSNTPLVFRDTGLRKLNIANGATDFTPGFVVGTGRNVAIDGIELSVGKYRDLEICPSSTLSVDSGKVTLKHGNILVNTNATLNVNGGTVDWNAPTLYLKLAKNATVNFNGGSNVIGRIVNRISENKGTMVSEFDGDGSRINFIGGHNIFPDQYSFSSYVDQTKTAFSFTGGMLELFMRIGSGIRTLLPPKGGILRNRSFGLSMTDENCDGEVWELGGKAYFVGTEGEVSPYANFGWGKGAFFRGGGELHIDALQIGNNPCTADISKVVLKTDFRSSGNVSGEMHFNDGIVFGACGDIGVDVPESKHSKYFPHGALVFETTDAYDGETARSFDLATRFNFSGVTSIKVDGAGSVGLVPQGETCQLKYLRRLVVDDGAVLSLTNSLAAVRTLEMTLGANSVLLVGSNAVDVAGSAIVGDGAKIRYGFESLNAGTMHPLWFGPHGSVPPVGSFEFQPSLPEGWTVAVHGVTAYLHDGTVADVDEPNSRSYWTGMNGGNWNDSGNWTVNTSANGEALNNIPGDSVSLAANFSGNRQLAVTNDCTGLCWLRNLIVSKSAGPYVVGGGEIALLYPQDWGDSGSSVGNSSRFPFAVESKLFKHWSEPHTQRSFFNVLANSDAPIVLAGGGVLTNAVFRFRGDVRLGGEWETLGLYPASGGGRDTRMVLMEGAALHATEQSSNQAVSVSYQIADGAAMTLDGTAWNFEKYENTHFVDGVVTSLCPVQATARQTFIGDGSVAFDMVQSAAGEGSLKFAEGITARFGGWKTVRDGADNAMRMVVRDNATIGAMSDWTYGPESGFESNVEPSARALSVIGGAATRVKFDTEGYTVTIADPLVVEKWSTVVKEGEGALVLDSGENRLEDAEFELLAGELRIGAAQAFGKMTFGGGRIALGENFLADSYELLFTAKKIVGEVEVSGRCRIRTVADGDGVSVFARRERGTAIVVR